MTRGSGSYRVTLNGCQEAPREVTQKLVEEYRQKREAGNKK